MALLDVIPYDLADGTKSVLKTSAVPEKLAGGMDAVVGRPHRFMENTDPKMRTFVRHMLPSAPLVMIRPGRVKFAKETEDWLVKKLMGFGHGEDEAKGLLHNKDDGTGKAAPGSVFSKNYGVSDEDYKAIQSAIDQKQKGTVADLMADDDNLKSARYFEFDSSNEVIKEYQSVMYTLATRIFSRMNDQALTFGKALGSSVTGDWQPEKMTNAGFYTFWADNATSVSESASNEVGATKLGGLVKTVAEISREAQFFMKSNLANQSASEAAKNTMIESAIGGVASFIGGDVKDGNLRASLGDAILGMNPMFPEVWKDSAFSRSYTLNFKFHSPYGSPASVYNNVLLPFIMLMSLVMPVQASPGTYSEPFVFQLDCPGHFACDLGICTDFSFTKGGSENLWTVDGLPRQIDVNMSVRDLYPVLTASKNAESLYFNVGMGTFLDNLGGIALYKTKNGQGDLITRMKAGAYNKINQIRGTGDRWQAQAQDFAEQYTPIPAIFRALGG